jgi:ATP-dependent DNA ligase
VISPCLPTLTANPPSGPEWIHEIKLDGYRMMVRRRGDRVKVFTKTGADWSGRYPLIEAAALALRATSFVLDGEATWCGPDGVPSFDVLHSRSREHEVCLQAFDLLELDGEDLRPLPLETRKARLARLLKRAPAGLHYVDHFDDDGPTDYRHACRMGLEGIVSKRRDLPHHSGKSARWRKVRNPKAAAATRVLDGTFGCPAAGRASVRSEPPVDAASDHVQ